MKKKQIVSLLGLSLFLAGSINGTTIASGEENKVENEITEQLEQDESSETVSKAAPKMARQRAAGTMLSAEDYQKVLQLQAEYKTIYDNLPTGEKFITAPLVSAVNGYALGTFKNEQTESIDDIVNFYRRLAGVDEIPYSSTAETVAQQASIGMAAVQTQSHYIYDNFSKPAGMTDEFWLAAGDGAKYSNIHSSLAEQTIEYHANSFMVDYGSGNKQAGHRRGILGLTAADFGVGYAKAEQVKTEGSNFFTALYVNSTWGAFSKYSTDTVSHWPAEGMFPYEMYNAENPYNTDYYKNNTNASIKARYEKNMRWSVFMHQNNQYLPADSVKVYLTDNDTGVTTEIKNDTNGGELTVVDVTSSGAVNRGYDTIVFRPNNSYEVKKDTVYTVKVTGIERNGQPTEYQYDTRFVGMYDQYQGEQVAVTGVEVTASMAEMMIGESQQLTATVKPELASNKTVNWTSSNTEVASVSATGVVTAKKKGSVVITATTEDGGKTAQTTLNVLETYPDITKITITRPEKNIIYLNGTMQLEATLEPANANRNDLVWESANAQVATVANGLVTGKKNGIVTITAKSAKNGAIKDSYQVVVTNKDNKTYLTKTVGQTITDTFDYGAASEHFSWNEELLYGSHSSTGSKGMYRMTAPEAGTYRIKMNVDLDNPDTAAYEREYGVYNEFFEMFAKDPDGSLTQLNSIYYSVNIDYYTAAKGWTSNRKVLKYNPEDTVIELAKNETIHFQVYARSRVLDDTFWISNGKLNYEHGVYMGTSFEMTMTKE
ncbi:Ig-like domain-containing protein [Enterococcus sp. BWR-S5]|uniref:Ig-like domain-containing protein n=1 Tax=Enterococcus sp. BWR-S5 TaxID=2787714 RepID=UPI001922DD33|nr:Ig-like domain-containing protein [Enterococcus sp. BWR-S5]MBL1224771.1 Ig-like domain-containing protein [Enterococcus sp. BWR-S5]